MAWAQQVFCKPAFLMEASDLDGLMERLSRRFHVRSSRIFDVDAYELLDLSSFGQAQVASDDLSVLLLSPGLSAICEPGLFGVDIVVEYLPDGPFERKLALVGLGAKTQLSSEQKVELLEVMEQVALPAEKYASHDREEPERSQAFRQRCDQAQVLATFFSCHPRVSHVEYFGLKDCKSRKLAERVWRKGFTPYLQLRLKPSVDATLVSKKAALSPLLASVLSLKPLPSGDMLIEVIGYESASKRLEDRTLAEGLKTSFEAQRTALMACMELGQILRSADIQGEDAL